MFIFLMLFFTSLNILSILLLFDIVYTKQIGYADITVYIKAKGYQNETHVLNVSEERKRNYVTGTYRYDVKVLKEYVNNKVKVRLKRSHVLSKCPISNEGKTLILDKNDINFTK